MKIFSNVKKYTTTVGERNEVDDTMALPLLTQAILGNQILDPKWSWKSKLFEHIFIFGLVIYVFFGTVDVLNKAEDLVTKGEAYYTYLITLLFLVKYWSFVNNKSTFQRAYFLAKTSLLEIIKMNPEKSVDLISKMQIIVKLFFGVILFPIGMYVLAAFWYNMHGERVTLSKTTSILMPMTSPYYEFGFVLHLIYLFHVAFTICVIDMWFVLVMFFYCATSDCVEMSLKVEAKGEDETEEDYATRLNDTLRTFYQNHSKLMEYLNVLCVLYKWSAVIPLVGVLLSGCLIMFLTTEQVQWSFLGNFLPPVTDVFAYNWFGEQVKVKALRINMALIQFDWRSMKLADRKNYLIIISYMQKEFRIKTAIGSELSLETMTEVLKAMYQAFTLLKTMKD
ncbi:uncharacterized protein LOC142973852 [Anticarsia gemmatalis]|uniref:uncharacterized protein LOC142973852 n=1 Tax=Anticarsia gemmatalis TaxID=129554 RepID=UPI003F75F3C9